jgi:CubicO group peptidase (beta-lactamase class C family)
VGGAGSASPERFAEVDRLLETAVADGAFPGAVVAVGHRGRLVHLAAFGRQTYAADAVPIAIATIFDLASLTKVVATTTVAMILVDEGKLELDARVDRYLPAFTGPGKDRVTVRHLLAHAAGIEWWAPLFRELEGEAAYVERIEAMPLASEPGTKEVYSDLGVILLGAILEQVSGSPLDRYAAEHVFAPLGMRETLYRPPAALLPRIAPTERDDAWRERVVHGEVHDENAFAMGGVAPHAGLFSTARDLSLFAQMMLDGGRANDRRIVSSATIDLFTRRAGIVPGSDRALGWDTRSAEGSSAGTLFSPSAFGHTGFTGTSLWIDPERELYLILLTNRVHPTRENRKIAQVRPAVADAVVRAIESRR